MTLTIIFGLIIIIGIFLCYHDIFECASSIGIFFAVIALIINLACWLPADKDSELTYEKMLVEKTTIEAMLDTNKDVDRFQLGNTVIDYNNRVIKYRTNYNRWVYREYYSKNVDWSVLQIIEWR